MSDIKPTIMVELKSCADCPSFLGKTNLEVPICLKIYNTSNKGYILVKDQHGHIGIPKSSFANYLPEGGIPINCPLRKKQTLKMP